VSNGDYYQPVYHVASNDKDEQGSRFELLQLDLQTGGVEARVETDVPLGNLICHREQIVSQGAQWVGALYQVDPLRQVVATRLAANENDAWAVARKAQLLRHDGKDDEALVALRRAYELDNQDDYTRQLLIDTMLKFLAQDFAAHRAFVDEIQRLDPTSDQRSEFLRLLIAGYQKTGELDKAFDSALKLAGLELREGVGPARPPMDQIAAHLTVRRDRWIRARLKELIDSAEAEQRAAIDAVVAQRLEEALAADAPSALNRFINYFGSHPLSDRARMRLAEKVIESGGFLEAELLLVRLQDAKDPAVAAPANFALARLMERAQRWSEAAHYYRRLEQYWPDAILENNQTATQILAAIGQDTPLGQALAGRHLWPTGRVASTPTEDKLANNSPYQKVFPIPLTQSIGGLPAGVRIAYDPPQSQLVLRDADGRELTTIFVANPHQSMRYPMNPSSSSVYHAKAHGHLVLVSFGAQLMAFNTLDSGQGAGEATLWSEDVDHEPDSNIRGQRISQVPQHNPWGDTLYFAANGSVPIGRFGPVNEHGVCLQRRSELLCVHPLTGEPIWTRENIEPGSEVFGDEEYLIVIPHDGRQAMVLGALDGALLGQRDVPARSNRWTTLGRRVLSFRQESKEMKLRMDDLVAPSPQDWERSFALESKGCLVERDKLAVLEPSGKFTLLSLVDGATLIETQLERERSLKSIYVLPSEDQYLLFTNSLYREDGAVSYQPPAIPDAPLVNGRIYAFDRVTGKSLWPSPAFVEQWGLPLDQPTGTPVLLLMRREMRSGGGGAHRNALAVMCLDRRDGTLIYEKNDMAANAGMGNDKYTLQANPAGDIITLALPYLGVTFRFTDEPRPPQPPVETGVLSMAPPPEGAVVNAGPFYRPVLPPGVPAVPPPPGIGPPQAIPQGVRLNVGGRLIPLFPGLPQPQQRRP
jgi:hypothetical protein